MQKNLWLLAVLLFLFSGRLIAQNFKKSRQTTQKRIINVDFSKTAGKLNTMFNECVGGVHANEKLQANWQQYFLSIR